MNTAPSRAKKGIAQVPMTLKDLKLLAQKILVRPLIGKETSQVATIDVSKWFTEGALRQEGTQKSELSPSEVLSQQIWGEIMWAQTELDGTQKFDRKSLERELDKVLTDVRRAIDAMNEAPKTGWPSQAEQIMHCLLTLRSIPDEIAREIDGYTALQASTKLPYPTDPLDCADRLMALLEAAANPHSITLESREESARCALISFSRQIREVQNLRTGNATKSKNWKKKDEQAVALELMIRTREACLSAGARAGKIIAYNVQPPGAVERTLLTRVVSSIGLDIDHKTQEAYTKTSPTRP